MHKYDLDHFLKSVEIAKKSLCGPTRLFSNVGDSSYEAFAEMKQAGIDGVYHCWRLGEGKDSDSIDSQSTVEILSLYGVKKTISYSFENNSDK